MSVDKIRNQMIKASLESLMPVCIKLFNLILRPGEMPDIWCKGLPICSFEVNSALNIKLGLCLLHTFTFVTSLLKKACIFCSAKLSNQSNNIGDEHGNFVVSFLQHHRHVHYMNYQLRPISLFPSVLPLTVFYPSLQLT